MNFLKNVFGKKDNPIKCYEDFWHWFQQNDKNFYDGPDFLFKAVQIKNKTCRTHSGKHSKLVGIHHCSSQSGFFATVCKPEKYIGINPHSDDENQLQDENNIPKQMV